MVTVDDVRKAQRAEGTATIMAIGTANPPNFYDQSQYAEIYARWTNSEHMTEVKNKMQRMCDRTMIKKRHTHITDEIMKENPNMRAYKAPSLDTRQDMAEVLISELGKEAANKAINEWGQSKSKITHLICCTTMGPSMPGIDYRIVKLLGLDLSVKRLMLYQQGCNAGGTVLRIAKDLAENTKGARVLVEVPDLIANHIENRLVEVFHPLGISDWNSIFWATHPGGRAILDQVEAKLGLKPEKLRASRHVLAEYGNMSCVTVLFILDETRKRSIADGLKTTGEGFEWGVLFGFGPGLTIETVVLHSVNIA
ncbi:hypothetical protein Pint_17983 [Pistacia integerrima]|uniref:Uncharacterized protein n=1 Tax=Pistacia integerrima TaxID=434235 RepID=A0ACC0Z1V8_9ROSI|nr:hypothetical protein Pint_17983 [Pistacia integerrima]